MKLFSRKFFLANFLLRQEMAKVPVSAILIVWCSLAGNLISLSKFFRFVLSNFLCLQALWNWVQVWLLESYNIITRDGKFKRGSKVKLSCVMQYFPNDRVIMIERKNFKILISRLWCKMPFFIWYSFVVKFEMWRHRTSNKESVH